VNELEPNALVQYAVAAENTSLDTLDYPLLEITSSIPCGRSKLLTGYYLVESSIGQEVRSGGITLVTVWVPKRTRKCTFTRMY
jgi:hypothetical protein